MRRAQSRVEQKRTGEQMIERRKSRLVVDGGREEVERGGRLLGRDVHEAQIVERLPVERREVRRALQTRDRLYTQHSTHIQPEVNSRERNA